jgi:hypothetical protein
MHVESRQRHNTAQFVISICDSDEIQLLKDWGLVWPLTNLFPDSCEAVRRAEGLSDVITLETDRRFTTLHYVIYSDNIIVRLDGQTLNIYKPGCEFARSEVTVQENISSCTGHHGHICIVTESMRKKNPLLNEKQK